jgi:uncharacterized protein
MNPRCIVIDGYNVIRNTPALRAAEARSLATGREALLERVTVRYRHTPHRVLVIFDGDGPAERIQPLRCGSHSQVIFSRSGDTADTVILRLTQRERAAGAEVEVITDDLAVRLGGAALGAAGIRSSEVVDCLHLVPHHLERRARHHAAVRARLDRDGAESAPATHPQKGNPRRKPRRRRGRPPDTLV